MKGLSWWLLVMLVCSRLGWADGSAVDPDVVPVELYGVLLVIGLIQGVVSHCSFWPYLMVGMVMPVLAVWGAWSNNADAAAMGYGHVFMVELLTGVVSGSVGWSVGAGVRWLILHLPGKRK